jgi:diguanylate cyclase (GGDEF)-like protein
MPKRLFKRRRRFEKRHTGLATLCGLIVTACIAVLCSFNILRNIELSLSDWLTTLKAPLPPPPEIVIIEIGQESLKTIQNWPIPRDIYARLIDILAEAKVYSIGIDVIFAEKSVSGADDAFAAAIRRAGMVYLPYYFDALPSAPGYGRPVDILRDFREGAKGEGFINVVPDSDGVVRWVQLRIPSEGRDCWQFAFIMACDRLGIDTREITSPPGKDLDLTTRSGEKISIPLDDRGAMAIDWAGPWRKAFRHYSLADILQSAEQAKRGEIPLIPLSELKGRICLVGLTIPGTFDTMRTPFDPLAPAVTVHASIIDQIMNHRFIRVASRGTNLLLLLALGIAMSILFPHLKPAMGIISLLAACILYAAFALTLFYKFQIRVAFAAPLITLILTNFAIGVHHEIVISLERSRLNYLATRDSLTGLYVIGHFRLLLDAEIAEAQESGIPLTLIMTDIDHFKQFNDTYGHQEGDFILREVTRIVVATCRELDVVGRYGGEEFIVMLPNAALTAGRNIAERIRKSVETHLFSHAGKKYKVTISLGVTQLARFDLADDFIKRADEALYDAKHTGRNRVCFKEPPEQSNRSITLG